MLLPDQILLLLQQPGHLQVARLGDLRVEYLQPAVTGRIFELPHGVLEDGFGGFRHLAVVHETFEVEYRFRHGSFRQDREFRIVDQLFEDRTVACVLQVRGPDSLPRPVDPVAVLEEDENQEAFDPEAVEARSRAPPHGCRAPFCRGTPGCRRLAQLRLQGVDPHTRSFGHPGEIDVALSRIGHGPQRGQQSVDGATSPGDRTEVVAFFQHRDLAVQNVDGLPDEVLHGLRAARTRHRVRILAVGKGDHRRLQTLGQEDIRRAEGRAQPRRIAVEENAHLGRVVAQQARVFLRERGTERRDGVLHADRGEGDRVHEPFDEERRALSADVVAGPPEAVQHRSLVEDRALGRIDVLRSPLARLAEQAAPESQNAFGHGLDRKDDPVAESVVEPVAVLALLDETELEEDPFVEAVYGRGLAERLPLVRRVAESEALARLAVDPAPFEVLPRALSSLPLPQSFPEERGRIRRSLVIGAPRIVAALVALDVAHLHAAPGAYEFDGIDEAHPLMLHEEREHVAGFARGEVVEERLGGHHVEGRRLFVLEGAQSAEVLAGLLELDKLADDPDDVGPRPNLLDYPVGNHATESSPR